MPNNKPKITDDEIAELLRGGMTTPEIVRRYAVHNRRIAKVRTARKIGKVAVAARPAPRVSDDEILAQLRANVGIHTISRQLQVSKERIRKLRDGHGIEPRPFCRNPFGTEERELVAQAMALLADGLSHSQAATRMGVHKSVIHRWKLLHERWQAEEALRREIRESRAPEPAVVRSDAVQRVLAGVAARKALLARAAAAVPAPAWR